MSARGMMGSVRDPRGPDFTTKSRRARRNQNRAPTAREWCWTIEGQRNGPMRPRVRGGMRFQRGADSTLPPSPSYLLVHPSLGAFHANPRR